MVLTLWVLLPGTAKEHPGRQVLVHLPPDGMEISTAESLLLSSQYSYSFCHTRYLRALLSEFMNEQECEQQKLRDSSPGGGSKQECCGQAFEEGCGGTGLWKSAVLKWMCSSIHQPSILAFLPRPHSVVWDPQLCWCNRLQRQSF